MDHHPYENWNEKSNSGEFLTQRREAIYGTIIAALTMALMNQLLFRGMNLGFALALMGCLAAEAVYLIRSGFRGGWYPRILLALCFVIVPGFARSDDGFVKFVLGSFLFVVLNMSLALWTGNHIWDPAGAESLFDAFRSFFGLGIGKLPWSFRGIRTAVREGGTASKNGTAVALGLVMAVPMLAILIPLLVRSDAAFEGLLSLLPEFDFGEAYMTMLFGGGLACVLYARTVGLVRFREEAQTYGRKRKRISHLTMNTALYAVCALYAVYLLSQMAYFVGGFSGILPEGFSLAEYARRGFFEMAWLCGLNLSLIIFGISMTQQREEKTPASTRVACFFLGMVTLFFVCAAGAKMVLYIGGYGLTRLRVLTMVTVAFLGITTGIVSIWLFLPKLPYMKIVVIVALIIGAAVLWADVDSIVAGYNVDAYLSGVLENIDVYHLGNLGSGAAPHLDRLAREATRPEIREQAAEILSHWYISGDGWNWTDHVARKILEKW